MTTTDMTNRPPWAAEVAALPVADQGTVTSGDIGQFEALLAGRAEATLVTPGQIADVQLVVQAALQQGQDAGCLDPTAPPHDRLRAFRAISEPAIKQGRIRDVTLADDGLIQALYVATYGWGPVIQPLLDDPHVWEIKIGGTWAIAEGAAGRQVIAHPYDAPATPLSRIQALAQTQGIRLDRERASETIPLPHKTRMHVTIPPLLPDDDLLIVIRRGRRHPWTLTDLVQRQTLSAEAADLLTGLIQAWPSMIFSGAQNSGKTTAMECAINALPPDLHHVLIEDHVDELRLYAPTLTRLQRTERTGSGAAGMWRMLREILRMTPDYLIPVEIRTDEASAVLELARIGRPVLTTLHEDTPQGALERFALRAATATTPENPFAGQYDAARQTLARVFDLVVHLTWSRRHWRRLVSSVHVLDGVDATGQIQLIPLIEAIPTEDGRDLTWVCHAEVQAGRLVWRDGVERTPARLARRLADVPTGTTAAPTMTTVQDIPALLADVQQALAFPQQTDDILTRLATALARDAEHPAVWQQARQALDGHAGVQAWAQAQVHNHLTQVQQALDQRDLAAAQQVISATHGQPVLQLALTRAPQWTAATQAVVTLEQTIQTARQTLQTLTALAQQGRYPEVQAQIARLDPDALPEHLAQQVTGVQSWLVEELARQAAPENGVAPADPAPVDGSPTGVDGSGMPPAVVTVPTPMPVTTQEAAPAPCKASPAPVAESAEAPDPLAVWAAYGAAIRQGTVPLTPDPAPVPPESPEAVRAPEQERPDQELQPDPHATRPPAPPPAPTVPIDTASADDVGAGLASMVDPQFLDQWQRRS